MKLFKVVLIILSLLVGVMTFKYAYDFTLSIMVWEINPNSYLDTWMNSTLE